ncbi:MAG: hypothetical protein LBE86_10220, partial [Gemmobacter sp.]|nr:hypothetical protein [Gemmobacter sp.]
GAAALHATTDAPGPSSQPSPSPKPSSAGKEDQGRSRRRVANTQFPGSSIESMLHKNKDLRHDTMSPIAPQRIFGIHMFLNEKLVNP